MQVSILKILLLFLLDYNSFGDFVNKQKYTSVFVEKGEDVVLNCTCCLHNESSWSGPKISSITKTDKNEEETYAVGLMLNPILQDLNIEIIGDNNTNDCSLVVTNLSEVGVGHYICEYWKSGIVYIHNFTVNLKTPPNNLTFLMTFQKGQQKHIHGIEGRTLDIICTVNSGKPPETLILKENGSTIHIGKSGKIVYSFVPSKEDHMKSFECVAVSDTLERPLTDEVILDIQYKPSLIVDHPARDELIENTSTQVCCQGNSNPPMDQIKWKGNVKYIVLNNTTSCLTFNPINRTNTQIYTCFASNGIGISELHIYLKVLYPPMVSVSYAITGQTINLHCHPKGEPNSFTFAKWYYRSEFNDTIRQIEGTQTGNLTIIEQSNKTLLEHVGIYVCRASNGILARNGNVYQKGAVSVQYKATEKDFVNYTLEACNMKGCNSFTVHLRSANRPETPNNLTVVPYGTHIIMSWKPGFNGGFSQLFFIQYRTGNKEDWSTSDPINDTLVNTMTYTLNDMVSNTQYFFRMFSTNIIGDSDKTNVTVARTYDLLDDENGINTARIAVIITITVFVILVISAGVVLFLKKKANYADHRISFKSLLNFDNFVLTSSQILSVQMAKYI